MLTTSSLLLEQLRQLEEQREQLEADKTSFSQAEAAERQAHAETLQREHRMCTCSPLTPFSKRFQFSFFTTFRSHFLN